MEEMYWRQFLETGKISDYLAYVENEQDNHESEEFCESDYSDGHGASGISYR